MKKFLFSILLLSSNVFAQNFGPNVTGNTENIFQYLNNDTIIGAIQPESKTTFNSYTYVNYTLKGFRAGIRFESYLPAILGYPTRFSGSGIGYKYAGFSNDMLDVTIGNFYEQFGSGMTFRAYEARALGVDNALDGINIRFRPHQGVEIKAVYGKMRYELKEGKLINADGFVRGVDGEFNLNALIKPFAESKLNLSVGGSFVSKNQKAFHALYNMPNNVGTYGGRIKATYKNYYLEAEHVIKEQDPSLNNDYIYNYGFGSIITAGYSQKGLGIILQAKSIDNMSYRVDPDATLTDLNINFLPASTKAHTYNLAATLYPYGTNLNGEISFSADVMYKIPKKSKLGGKYGTSINVNYVIILAPNRDYSQQDTITRELYTTTPFAFSDSLFLKDFNVEIKRKFSKKFKMTLKYFNFRFNNDVNQVTKLKNQQTYIDSHIGVIDFTYKFNRKHSLRTEIQGLFTKRDKGNWATLLFEYNISPKWFFSVIDQYNYGNEIVTSRVHYLTASAGYLFGSSRFIVSYGRQRAGIFCVGGVCRNVPATNGLTITFVSSF
ncbi:MAG TPA: hypothetical protein EYG85_01700 [Crocinitomix sp.]|nr:hypothetical protein [Crocinitomix sp.]